MSRNIPLLIFFLIIFARTDLFGITPFDSGSGISFTPKNDSLENQVLYNGRLWRNLYYKVKGDQFLFSKEFLPGSVTINGITFNNVNLKYDIYSDEILTFTNLELMLKLNKEMVENFTIGYNNKIYKFKKFEADSLNSPDGFVNILFEGKTALYVKYIKRIRMMAVDNKYDLFEQIQRIYIRKDGKIFPINSKKDIITLLKDHKKEITNYIKNNKIKISRKKPGSFVPVLEYYDTL